QNKILNSSVLNLCLIFSFCSVMSLVDVRYCYILDAILLLYGFILTVLYCRLRVRATREKYPKKSDDNTATIQGKDQFRSVL
uniref:Fc receptor gamma-chain n=1 Tax=Neogobius melanostomus TaxID=47308 RepID=A0A8C6SMJ7_9GOBI